ncbi:MAG: RNA polymerase subunit sigma [Spirochaetales bacterium]|nr:RNA polymerase subunit sigma [Spirochaetales bacterium]
MTEDQLIETAAKWIKTSRTLVAFTGAGISVESGIPSFRGRDGIWNSYDPEVLEISYFRSHPLESWEAIRDIFYTHFSHAHPNEAHFFLSDLERAGILKFTITQNIDDLHYRAGSRALAEFHGNSRQLVCQKTGKKVPAPAVDMTDLPPISPDGGLYKPDFVFFGEPIPAEAALKSQKACEQADTLIIIGSTGEVYPAAALPGLAKQSGARIIEINPETSAFSAGVTDLYIPMGAESACLALRDLLQLPRTIPGYEDLATE